VAQPERPHGYRLREGDGSGLLVCPGSRYRDREEDGMLRCVDRDEDANLPPEPGDGRQR
jgi:hypothetical protein